MSEPSDLLALTIDVVSSYVGKNNLRPDDVPAFIASTHAAIKALGTPEAPAKQVSDAAFTPAVSARKSLSSGDHIISMIDGKPYKTLKRHLSTNGLTPAEYRTRYGLKPDYPMVAPAYSATRKALAQKIGLGRKPQAEAAAPAAPAAKTSKAKGGAKGGIAALKAVRQRAEPQAQAESPAADEAQQD